jgi:hypothetical protein
VKGQRPKLTLAERRKRQARNERRGRNRPPIRASTGERVRTFRYGQFVVRVSDTRVEIARDPHGMPMFAAKGVPPRHTRMYAPLPERERQKIRAAARKADDKAREERLKEQGIEIAKADVYQPAAMPSGAFA